MFFMMHTCTPVHVAGRNAERISVYKNIKDELDRAVCALSMKIEDKNFEMRDNFSVDIFRLNDAGDKVTPVGISEYHQ